MCVSTKCGFTFGERVGAPATAALLASSKFRCFALFRDSVVSWRNSFWSRNAGFWKKLTPWSRIIEITSRLTPSLDSTNQNHLSRSISQGSEFHLRFRNNTTVILCHRVTCTHYGLKYGFFFFMLTCVLFDKPYQNKWDVYKFLNLF